jgi:hypothetical protein
MLMLGGAKVLMERSPDELFAAACIVVLTGAVLIAHWRLNPGAGADHYYKNTPGGKPAFAALQACYVVIATALAFNARFLIAHCVDRLTRSIRSPAP